MHLEQIVRLMRKHLKDLIEQKSKQAHPSAFNTWPEIDMRLVFFNLFIANDFFSP